MIDLLYNDSILNSVKAQMPPAVCGVGQAELFRRSARRSSREDIGIEDQERGGGRIAATSLRTGLAMTDSGPCSAVGGGALDAPLFSELQPAARSATHKLETPP